MPFWRPAWKSGRIHSVPSWTHLLQRPLGAAPSHLILLRRQTRHAACFGFGVSFMVLDYAKPWFCCDVFMIRHQCLLRSFSASDQKQGIIYTCRLKPATSGRSATGIDGSVGWPFRRTDERRRFPWTQDAQESRTGSGLVALSLSGSLPGPQ